MDLILWRHAEAEEGASDLERELTAKGQKQAARVAEWLLARLPARFSLIASPAARAQQTAQALGVAIKTSNQLAPGAAVSTIIKAAGWPDSKGTVVIVGHQPDLGRAVAYLAAGADAEWRIKKGGLWWLRNGKELIVRAVVSPDLL
jgi:phosphohistidine phosphatase